MAIPQSQIERARAAQRLAFDGEAVPVAELTQVAGATAVSIVRWIKEGKSRVYLDGIEDPLKGWCSSVAAVKRFQSEVAEKRAKRKAGAS